MIRLALLIVTLASPVHALSCLRPDSVRLFQAAKESPDTYVMVRGRLLADGPVALPDPESQEVARTTVRVEGMGLSRSGFDVAVARDVILELRCLAVWCPKFPGGDEAIMALKVEGETRILTVDACGGELVPWTEDQEKRLLDCTVSGDCTTLDGF